RLIGSARSSCSPAGASLHLWHGHHRQGGAIAQAAGGISLALSSCMTRLQPRGAALVDLVIEKVRAGTSPLRIHDPRPLPREVVERLTFADGAPLPPSLRRWLEFDASSLVRSLEMLSSLDDPRLSDRPLAELAAEQWGDDVRPFFTELGGVVPGRGVFLDRGCDSFRLLSTGGPAASG